jgi:hypothetical protein
LWRLLGRGGGGGVKEQEEDEEEGRRCHVNLEEPEEKERTNNCLPWTTRMGSWAGH